MILASLTAAIVFSVLSSVYVCYNVSTDPDSPRETLTTISAVILLNALVPFALGSLTMLWHLT